MTPPPMTTAWAWVRILDFPAWFCAAATLRPNDARQAPYRDTFGRFGTMSKMPECCSARGPLRTLDFHRSSVCHAVNADIQYRTARAPQATISIKRVHRPTCAHVRKWAMFGVRPVAGAARQPSTRLQSRHPRLRQISRISGQRAGQPMQLQA